MDMIKLRSEDVEQELGEISISIHKTSKHQALVWIDEVVYASKGQQAFELVKRAFYALVGQKQAR
jgi:hypothetical protein